MTDPNAHHQRLARRPVQERLAACAIARYTDGGLAEDCRLRHCVVSNEDISGAPVNVLHSAAYSLGCLLSDELFLEQSDHSEPEKAQVLDHLPLR